MGGANFKLAANKRSIYHPLRDMFAIHMMDEYENFVIPQLTKAEIFLPQKGQVWLDKVEQIREYYVCTTVNVSRHPFVFLSFFLSVYAFVVCCLFCYF